MSQTTKNTLIIIITVLALGTAFYFWQNQKTPTNEEQNENSTTSSEVILNQNPSTTSEVVVEETQKNYSTITIMVPQNIDSYKKNMTEFVQTGGVDPLLTTTFIKKEITIPYTKDLIQASAQAAAQEIAPSGGPAKASVAYFKITNNTAYVLLDIDVNGWAGVSVSIGMIHPLVEKTLLQFPEITNVVFDYAPDGK